MYLDIQPGSILQAQKWGCNVFRVQLVPWKESQVLNPFAIPVGKRTPNLFKKGSKVGDNRSPLGTMGPIRGSNNASISYHIPKLLFPIRREHREGLITMNNSEPNIPVTESGLTNAFILTATVLAKLPSTQGSVPFKTEGKSRVVRLKFTHVLLQWQLKLLGLSASSRTGFKSCLTPWKMMLGTCIFPAWV